MALCLLSLYTWYYYYFIFNNIFLEQPLMASLILSPIYDLGWDSGWQVNFCLPFFLPCNKHCSHKVGEGLYLTWRMRWSSRGLTLTIVVVKLLILDIYPLLSTMLRVLLGVSSVLTSFCSRYYYCVQFTFGRN